MFKTFRSAWGIPEIRKKILYMVLLIIVFRVGSYIPIPGVNPRYISEMVSNNSLLGYLDLMTGGSFGKFTVLALGITPYINASIIMQLLTIAIPALEHLQKEGEMGRKKIERITRYMGVAFSFIMGIGIVYGMGTGQVIDNSILPQTLSYITIALVLAAGTTFLMWMSEQITEIGIGNGSSMIIFIGIVSRLPQGLGTIIQSTFKLGNYADPAFVQMTGLPTLPVWALPLLVVGALLIIAAVTFIDLGERRVPIQYAKRVVGRKMYGGQSSYIPVRVNANGVLPLIFAMTLMQLPQIFVAFWPASKFAIWWTEYLGTGSVIYFILYTLLIIAFSYFYTMITFNPIELSKNMQAQGGFIPGIRPGRPTSEYLSHISNRLTLVSAIFLALIAALPTLLARYIPGIAAFGATSLLIMVSVALETSKQLEAQITMRTYKGFLK